MADKTEQPVQKTYTKVTLFRKNEHGLNCERNVWRESEWLKERRPNNGWMELMSKAKRGKDKR